MSDFSTEYKGCTLVYHEHLMKWQVEGSDERADQLADLKKKLDNAENQHFVRLKAYLEKGGEFRLVEVTSFAGPTSYSNTPHYWTVCNGRRSKEWKLYAGTPDNVENIDRITALRKEISARQDEVNALIARLEPLRQEGSKP